MARKTGSASVYRFAFARIGGIDQVLLRGGGDVAALPELDQKLWAALAMPLKAAGVGPETLAILDGDSDGRIRAADVLGAVRFCAESLDSLDVLLEPGDAIPMGRLRPGPLAEAAAWVLEREGKAGAPAVSLADVASASGQLAGHPRNGDGVVPPAAAGDAELSALVFDIVAAGFGAADLSGAPGASEAGLDGFLESARSWLEWHGGPAADAALLPLGARTHAAWTAIETVRAKVQDWFLRSRLLALAGGHGGVAWGQEARLAALLATGIRGDSPELAELPLCAPAADGVLDLRGPVNPAWAGAIETLAAAVVSLFGEGSRVDDRGWRRLEAALAPYGAWLAAQPAPATGALGEARLRAILDGTAVERLRELIRGDACFAANRQRLGDLQRLLLLRRDLARILRNFVNFSDFYHHLDAVFQTGRLYLDGRECRLCMDVDRPAAHAALAAMSGVYLVYCELSRAGSPSRSVVAALTAGEAGNLFVGKNGVFYDRDGRDWDARVTRLQVQPISIREAFFSPYRWIARTIEELVAKRAAAAESSRQVAIKSGVEGVVSSVAPTPAPAPAAPKPTGPLDLTKKIDVGTVAAIGVALGSIGAMVTGVVSAFVGMGAWMPVGLVSILLLVSGPSMLLAYLKLRRRDLGPILDAEGWAINGRLRINVPFGNALTRLGVLPPGSERRLQDPFAEKRRPWALYLLLLLVVALLVLWVSGVADDLLPAGVRLRSIVERARG